MEALRVARVLPRLVLSPRAVRRSYSTKPSPSRSPYSSSQRSAASAGSRSSRTSASSSGPTPCLGEQHEEKGSRVDAAVVAIEPFAAHFPRRTSCTILPGSASRDGSFVVACSAASSRSALRASSGPNSCVWRRRDHRVAPEDRHEPRHPGRGQLAAACVVVRPHPQRRKVVDGLAEGVPKAVPARLDPRRLGAATPRPTRARGTLLAEMARDPPGCAAGRPSAASPTSYAGPSVSRGGEEDVVVGHSRASPTPPRTRIACVRPKPYGSTSTKPVLLVVVARLDRGGERRRVRRVAECEVPLLHGDDVREVGGEVDADAAGARLCIVSFVRTM